MARTERPFEVYCGIDVGKSAHHACALDLDGRRLHDKALTNDEAELRAVFTKLQTHGQVLVVIDQPASIGALAIAVARSMGIDVAYLPGLTMRRLADLHPGQAKTDARDAYVIADAALSHPRTLRRVGTDDETLADLSVLAGYDDDLNQQSTRLTNRLRDALLHVHPALERLLGNHIDRGGVIDLLAAAGTPDAIAALGPDGIAQALRPRSPRLAKTLPAKILPAKILAALVEQTVVVPGTAAFGRIITGVAAQLRDVRLERDELAAELEAHLEAHPLSQVLTSMPGVGFRTAIKILTIVGDGSAFKTAAHLASYAGLAPVTRSSGTSIKGESHSQRGHHALKSALFLSAFAALKDPDSRAYYDRKRAGGGVTMQPSSAWPVAASTSCSPCSATRPATGQARPLSRPGWPSPLDAGHRDTPRCAQRVVADHHRFLATVGAGSLHCRSVPSQRAVQDFIGRVANLPVVPARRWRGRLLRSAGMRAHARVDVYAGVRVAGEGLVVLGEGCFVNHDCYFDTAASITLGRAVALGDHVRIITSRHEIGSAERRAGPRSPQPVVIENGCWLGSGVTVLPGVTIGAGCVVGAGAVVVGDCAPHGLYAGVPARRLRDLP